MYKHRVRPCGPLPVALAVHREISPAERRDPADADIGELDLERLDVDIRGPVRHVDAVQYPVDEHIADAKALGHPQQGKNGLDRRMYARVAEHPDQMDRTAVGKGLGERVVKRLVLKKAAVTDRIFDPVTL